MTGTGTTGDADSTDARDLAGAVWPSLPAGSLVLLPLGSTEQHGPHLPLSTDSVIAQVVAERVAAALPPGAAGPPLVAPALGYGSSGEHAGFPGTVSLGHQALHAVIVETTRSLALWAERVVFVNGHGGNVPSLRTAVGQMRAEGHDVAWVGCGVPGGDAHAGFTETSVMLCLAPGQVRMDRAVAGDDRPLASIMPELVAHGVRAVSPSGVLGDPCGATAEHGREIVRAMVSDAVRRIAAWRADPQGMLLDPDEPSR
ncbi:mycofactocin biosynthesis peptidyl-dipeptidase MftE [Actinomadura scrupuli]|uniref:mycofactocin biosynthesis peptidyl-dipeptidase MftE n=1 Tax=Actinomadura scrupuli TaxID=559629 RepID=UPI003D973307